MPTRKNKDITRIVNRVNKSSADFVNRLKDPNRLTIPDWEDSRYVATHKLGVGTDDNGQVFIYPSVQNINGELVDFTNPKFGKWDGMDSAIERKDTVHVNSIQDGLDFTENYKRYYPKGKSFKLGGRRKGEFGLDIQYGGRAIPIGKNMVYFDGNSHENGGIGVGNELEVEGGEVGEYKDNTLRVFSSVPFLRGVSPAQLVMGGANPNKVFKAQENFKDRNRINDDGTRYEMGGEGKPKSKRSRPVTGVLPYGYTIRNLYAVENPYRKGIKGNIAKMYDNRTLGAGVDVVSGHPELYKKAKSGKMTKQKADETAVIHLRKDDDVIRNNYADVYGKAAADTLSYGPRFLVAQARYQQGNVRKAWSPIHEAMAKGDAKALKKAVLQVTPKDHTYRRKWIEDFKVYKMGGMIYTINGNVKNGLMSARPKAQYGLATKYLKKKNKTAEKSAEIKQNDEPKVLDIRNTAGYKVKQFAENPWVKYPVEVASYLLTGATAKGMQTGTKMAKKAVNKIDDILGKPRQEYLSRNVSDKTIKVGTIENPIRPKDSSRITKVYKPTINEISQAKQAVKPKTEPRIKSIDKIYKQVVGSKEPRSTVGNVPQWTEISYNPTNRTITAYDASVEFHKRISDILYDGLVKKYGKKGVDKAMKLEHISKYKYGGRIKAKAGKFLKYKNGVFTDPDSGEEYDVDPEVFKMRGNSFESGIIPVDENYTTSNYYYGSTFDNARPQFYVEKRLPLFGSQSIAEKAGIARSGWSYSSDYKPDYKNYTSDNTSVKTTNNDYVYTTKPNTGESYVINPLTGEWIRNGVTETSEPSIKGTTKVSSSTSSTPRGSGTKSSKPAISAKPATVEAKQPKLVERPKENLYITGIKNNAVKSPFMIGMEKISAKPASPSTGGGTQPKDGNWVPQYNLITGRDWLGIGTNLAGHMISYFANRDILDKYPMPTRPVMTPAVKLKTRVNINPDLTNSKEAELMGIEATNRNTSSSNTSLARNQRIMNESRDARNKLYAYKENAETQLINQDKLNRQGVYARNIAAYNDWLNKTYVAKTNKLLAKQQNLMSLINGIPMAVNNVLGNIETRKSTNDMIRAIAASNPNVDGRLLGIGDYYTQQLGNGKIAKYNKNHKFIKYV